MATLLAGIRAERVALPRLTVNVLRRDADADADAGDAPTLLLVHGNVSSALFWQPLMLALPASVRPIAVDLAGFGDTDPVPIDATRGLRDWADDVVALLDALGLDDAHLGGWSMGGGVVLQAYHDHPTRVRSLVLINPVSPFGFGGTVDVAGTLAYPDAAGSGAGSVNPQFVARLAAGPGADGAAEVADTNPTSPAGVLRQFYVHPPFEPPADLLAIYVESMYSTRVADDFYPGTSAASGNWPGLAPGERGVLNTMSPLVVRLGDLETVQPKPPVLWLRGAQDRIVADASVFDLATLGSLGVVPGWPEAVHPQPMVAQTRGVLDRYTAAGGSVREVVLAECGHSPHVEKLPETVAALTDFLTDRSPTAG